MQYSDFMRYIEYKQRRLLPFERLELMLARLCYITAGNEKANIKDFLLSNDFTQFRQPENVDLNFNWKDLPVKKMNFDFFKNKRIKK